MIRHLNADSRNKLEQKICQKLETESDGKKLGLWLNRINGLAIENRWHASECCRNTLVPMIDNDKGREILMKASGLHLHFHDQAWRIWALLGVSPQTGYGLPRNINELLDNSSTRAELKSLFQELFMLSFSCTVSAFFSASIGRSFSRVGSCTTVFLNEVYAI